ncbi:two-component sensor histidine kinase [Carnobacterium sp. 17-4]|uniref:cache domain-containing sensor histidine kinase n=1 Tax=Carnobacterium sp. (strain 17-4) TaxID=208596 RepID=UPI0002059194|nr:sensor histidine kinase [Carnobacterium sp. 17-4]AEB30928.1 two-component sensor histidine kinase [Carnobacterium sp. 17-4]
MSQIIKKTIKTITDKFKSLRIILALSLGVISIFTILLFAGFLSVTFKETLIATTKTTTQQSVVQSSITLANEIDNMTRMAYGILDELKSSTLQKNEIANLLGVSYRLNRNIVSIGLINANGQLVDYAPSQYTLKKELKIYEQDWFQEDLKPNQFSFSLPHVQNIFEKNDRWVLSGTAPVIVDKEEYLLLIDFNFNSIGNYFDKVSIGKRGYSFILDSQNALVYHPKQQIRQTNAKEENLDFIADKSDGVYITPNKENVIAVASVSSTGWKVIGVSYLQESIKEAMQEVQRYMLWVFLAIVSLVVLISIGVSKYIAQPITKMVKVMRNSDKDQFDIYTDETRFTEIQQLSGSYNYLIDHVKMLMLQVKEEQEELRKSEMNVLQAQINPHFLYNTLESILWMSERGNNEGASEMVAALGKLLRISLSKGNDFISLRQELAHAESYLTIQQIRYKNQFQYSIEADDTILDCLTVKIILQPFLENALYHGIERMVDEGNIGIKVFDKQDKILIQITDDGIGILPETLKEIEAGKNSEKVGIGIRNVHQRIQIYFGKDFGVEVTSEMDEGTMISIWLPKIVRGEDQKEK